MERHRAIIVGQREVYEDFLSEQSNKYWDYDNKIKTTIDKPPLEIGNSIYLEEQNRIIKIEEVIRTNIENTIMYKVVNLYDVEYKFEYEQDKKDFEYFKEKSNIDILTFGELKKIKTIRDYHVYNNITDYNFFINNHKLVKDYIGFDYEIIPYIDNWRVNYLDRRGRYYSLVKFISLEKKLKDEFKTKEKEIEEENMEYFKEIRNLREGNYKQKKELSSIKEKWWYKLFSKGGESE